MSAKPITFGSDIPTVFPAGPLEPQPESSLDASLARLVKSVKDACATIDRLRRERNELRAALDGLLRAIPGGVDWTAAVCRAHVALRDPQ